ncbi:hypothetical protein [Streptomyces sp. Je 1-369]|uniref:hypothetical protein n=1 Tax=Streptomyces sp. Je 1-369 TaxID=2966192 RepID=UPI0022863B9D|nr:hypothetical protein [Streptomyces sp. Je 1-369]WAL93937.1 hypothetical protein NOO62_05160 [Streptomyces sp. Je 1-369]
MTTTRRVGHLDIDGVDAVCTGRITAEQAEKVSDLVDERAVDASDRADLLDALGLTNTRKTSRKIKGD